ncbi:MAG: cation:proton antiporter [Methanocorpusculum sp.]|nr:cation:proton antiporter [Methanocorpusculum sp.]
METETDLIFAVVVVLACAIAIYFVGKKVRMPLIIGYFVTGILVGPFGLGLISEEQVSLLSEFGVILLMFTIGLEISLKNLLSMKRIVLVGGGLQLVLTTVIVWLIMMWFGFQSNVALFIGFLVAHSSTAIIMNIYQKSGEIDTQHGKISLGLLIFQDLNVVPMMMLVPLIAGTAGTNIVESVWSFVFGMIIMVLILVGAIYLVPKFLKRVAMTRSSELFIISIVVICFGIAWLMSLNGVSLALGAFLAGVAISESDYSHEVIGQIMPLRDILTSFFFVSIGMMLNLPYLWQHLLLILGLAALMLIGKTAINFVSVKLIGVATGAAMLSAIGLSQVGEFSFILGSTGLTSGILTEEVYQVFLAISIVTMAVTPFIVSAGPPLVKKFFTPKIPVGTCSYDGGNFDNEEHKKCREHVIIVGYGLAGKYVATALKKVHIPYIIIEMNSDTVAKEKAAGENIIYGDAGREGILDYAGIMKAGNIVISIPNMESVKAIISTARRLNPKIGIITRSRFISETTELYRLGADEVIVDEREAAIQIFKRILRNENVPEQDIALYSTEIRNDVYNKYIDAPESRLKPNKRTSFMDSVLLRARRADDAISPNKTSVEQIHVEPGCYAAGKKLCEIHMRGEYGISVIAIKRKNSVDSVVSPDGDTLIEDGDTVVVIGERSAITKIVNMFVAQNDEK